tara:strand:- start:1035 stop:1928 length:894 start_codon:yes stop_codon:yes gene_type:complete
MTVLVTGASGFVGRRLCKFLIKKNISVRVVLRKKDITFGETILCDFEKETLSFEAFHDVETVFHLAGCTHDVNNKRNIDIYRKINTETTTKIAEMAGANKVKNFVFVSSVKAGGSPAQGKIISEIDQGDPEGIYGVTKRDAELKLLDIGSQSKMHISIVRPTLIYGPGLKGNFLQMHEAVAKGWFPPLPFINNSRSLIHVDDLVRALWLVALDGRARNQIYIATDGESYSSREIYESICHSLDKPIPKWYIPYFIFLIPSLFSGGLRHKVKKLFEDSNYSSKKLESLGFKAKYSFRE